MKGFLILLCVILAACATGAGILWWDESQHSDTLARQVAHLEADNDSLARNAAMEKEKEKALESESDQLRAARAIGESRLEPQASATPAPDAAQPAGHGSFFTKMFKDPEMRKMIAAQQAGALRGIYSDFIKEAHLTPDEADKFFQLLQDRQMAMMDSSASAISGSAIDMNAATAVTNTADMAVKDLLGADRYGLYEDFEKTLADRIQVQQLSQQLGAVGEPLQDYQSQALVRIMNEERANLPAPGSGGGIQQASGMSQADLDQYAQQLDQMNQRVYNRAMSVLSPAQLSAFSAFQKNMATAQVAGLKMAQGMFKGDQ